MRRRRHSSNDADSRQDNSFAAADRPRATSENPDSTYYRGTDNPRCRDFSDGANAPPGLEVGSRGLCVSLLGRSVRFDKIGT